MPDQQYISMDDAASQLQVARATLYYYIRTLKLNTHKFPLDKRAYLTVADFERIKTLKDQAMQRGKAHDEDAA